MAFLRTATSLASQTKKRRPVELRKPVKKNKSSLQSLAACLSPPARAIEKNDPYPAVVPSRARPWLSCPRDPRGFFALESGDAMGGNWNPPHISLSSGSFGRCGVSFFYISRGCVCVCSCFSSSNKPVRCFFSFTPAPRTRQQQQSSVLFLARRRSSSHPRPSLSRRGKSWVDACRVFSSPPTHL